MKKITFKKVAFVCWGDLPSDVEEEIKGEEIDLDGKEMPFVKVGEFYVYNIKSLETNGRCIYISTIDKMDNLRKQLKGFDYFAII